MTKKTGPEFSDIAYVSLNAMVAALGGFVIGGVGFIVANRVWQITATAPGSPESLDLATSVAIFTAVVFWLLVAAATYIMRRNRKTCAHCGAHWSARFTGQEELLEEETEVEDKTETERRTRTIGSGSNAPKVDEKREIHHEITWLNQKYAKDRKCVSCGEDSDLVEWKKTKMRDRVVHSSPWQQF